MEEFLNKICFIKINVNEKVFYYLRSKLINISNTHITFEDTTRNDELHSYRIADIIEIKLSNKVEAK